MKSDTHGLGIYVDAIDTHGNEVFGELTGTGAGKYTGLLLKSGHTVAVIKSTVVYGD